ncbi:hypothetical protein [Frigoriflavimonas asaccharolytica]|uniref:Uncharacterized protein n=1 Tax=Frigoriflavimonas asaccharolytica TaxID=2735899 RepID=A0A8J8K7S3_9FLAO|nr:hypothetical protein [Frigoriflavimonas asaccharolytica]NRS91247.1 hypothetical protein [Frigoriflavimonas asaccharolytica]
MSKFLLQKRKLIKDVFEKAEKTTTEKSLSGILKDLEFKLQEDFKIQISYKTLENYYKNLVENNVDYNIKSYILDDLCKYIGFENFAQYCDQCTDLENKTSVKVSIDGKKQDSSSSNFSEIIINITNSPIFTLPEFVSKNKNSFGFIGIILLGSFIVNKFDQFANKTTHNLPETSTKNSYPIVEKKEILQNTIYKIPHNSDTELQKPPLIKKKKDCMYWNEEQYISVYCGENIDNFQVEQFNLEKYKLKKITQQDTLTAENALGKVWYDKTNNVVEFFTNHGIHPENNKTLKEVTPYILEKYCTK